MTKPWSRPLQRWPPALVLSLLAMAAAVVGQIRDPKVDFTEALAQFSLALDGTYGDEGPRVLSSLESMARGLARWDETIAAYERAAAAEMKGAEPTRAALAHLALGGVYLDRHRIADGRREFAAAAALDPGRADAYTLQGLTTSQSLPQGRDAALAAFQKASTLDSGDVVRAYLLARQLMSAGKAEDARNVFRLVVANYQRHAQESAVARSAAFMRFGIVEEKSGAVPFFPPAAYEEGFGRLARGEYAEAITSLRASTERDSLVADQANRYGMKRAADEFRSGSLDAAAQQLAAAIELAPDRAEPHRILGLVYAADEQYDRAIRELTSAVRLAGGDERARLALADAFIRSEQYPAAEQALRETIARLPASGRAHYLLARLYERQGRDAEAVAEFQTAATSGPLLGLNTIYRAIGLLSNAKQNFDAARQAYSRRVDINPNDADAHLDLAEADARVGRSDEALAEFAVAVTIDPGNAGAHAGAAQLHLAEGRYAESADAARRALALDPAHRQARYVLATSLIRLGRTDDGQRELAEFQRLQAEDAAARTREFELGGLKREASVSSANGDHEKAIVLLRKALDLEPASAAAHLNLGLELLRSGQPAEAVARLQASVALNGPIDAHRYLADAYASLARAEDSRRELAIYTQLRRDQRTRAGAGR